MKSRAVVPAVSKAAFRIALFAVLAVFALSTVSLHAQSASTLYKRGQSAEAQDDYDTAFDNYQKACAKAPKDLVFRTALYRVKVSASTAHLTKGRRLLLAGDQQGALVEFLHASQIDPSNEAAQQEISRLRQKQGEALPAAETSLAQEAGTQEELNSMSEPLELKPLSDEPLTLHMTEDAKVVYQAVGKASGVNVLFDPDYSSKRIQVDLNNVSMLDALRIVGTMSNTFWRPVTSNSIFVAQNTRAKRTELDEQAVQTFYLTNAWQQNDLNDVGTALRNVMPNAHTYPVPSQNAIVMRGTPDELLLAQKLINDLDKARAEVVVDIAILEVSKNWERNLGIAWPSSFGIALQPNSTSSTTSSTGTTTGTGTSTITPSLYDLANLKASNFAITVGTATLNLLMSDSNTKVLQSPRIRATDSQKVTMKIGSRIPVATGSYGGGGLGAGALGGISSLVNTQFQYQDVGVNIEMTPTVHYNHDVTLKIKIDVSSHSGDVTISQVTEPILSQRVVDQVIRLREGEANIMGGIQNTQDTTTSSGIPGLGSIPFLKYIFGTKDRTYSDDEVVFVVVPHIVRTQTLDATNLRTIDTGVGQSIELRHTPSAAPGSTPVPASVPAVRPASIAQPNVGTVPGQSAQAAAPAALAQLREAVQATSPTQPVAPPAALEPPGALTLVMAPLPGPVPYGTTFQIPVVLNHGVDIASVPLQIKYDPARLSLVNVAAGDFLGKDGQAVALVHRDDGPGLITINTSRPPGAKGVSGSGSVCVLSFQGKGAGISNIEITRPGAVNSAQQQVPAQGARITVQVQ